MGQSTISTSIFLSFKQAGLVEDRRTGKSSLYRLIPAGDPGPSHLGTWVSTNFDPGSQLLKGHDFSRAEKPTKQLGLWRGSSPVPTQTNNFLANLLAQAAAEIPEAEPDQSAMRLVLKKRQDKMRTFFDSVAGRLGKDYVPGKSWKSLAEALLRLMPPMVIADLGAGEGSSALLLSQSAVRVIAVDTSANMLEVARDQALRAGIQNVEYRLGDMEDIPIDSSANRRSRLLLSQRPFPPRPSPRPRPRRSPPH